MSTGEAARASSVELGFETLRSRAVVSPIGDRSLLVVRGDDRTGFLQGMLSNEVASLEPEGGTRALLLTDQGRVVADLWVLVLADAIWLDVPAEARSDVRAALERFVVADDVEIEPGTAAAVALRGPEAALVLGRLAGEDAPALEIGGHRAARIGGIEGRVVRVDDLGVTGFLFWTETSGSEAVVAAACAAGAMRVEEGVFEVQRVVAGVGRLGAEFGLDTLAPEVPSLAGAISHRKGCYLGQEVVERIAARGHVNWKVAVLRSADAVFVDDVVVGPDGDAGRVTSAVRRPDDGSHWALARVRAVLCEPGTMVQVQGAQGARAAVVVEAAHGSGTDDEGRERKGVE